MVKMKVISLILFVIFQLIITVSGEVSTGLEISDVNIAPQLISNIPNQTWAINTNLTDAFDLDDYFIDNDEINYTSSFVDSIVVVINETTRKVSFYPDPSFYGIRTVIFTASDGELSSNSNTVTLNVTPDSNPPKWSSISMTPSTIRQNTIAKFLANWEDDVALKNYILSMNEAGSWINYTSIPFSGKLNTSEYSVQISSPENYVVYWRFFAFDTSGNMNSTSINNFTIQSSPNAPSSSDSSDSDDEETEDQEDTTSGVTKSFTVEPKDGFKIDIVKGEEKTVSLRITNTATTSEKFSVNVTELDKFEYVISKPNFTIPPGGSEIVTISIKAKQEAIPDIYYGLIKIKTNFKIEKIPLIVELNAQITKIGLNLNITNKKDFAPLQNVTANITLVNLQDVQSSDIYFYYALADYNGNIIESFSEQFVLNAKSITLVRSLRIPENTEIGNYVFFARAITNGSIAIDSDLFNVGKKSTISSFILKYIWMVILISSIILTIFIAITEYRNRKRLNLLNIYIMTNELSRLVKENNFNEAQKVFIKIKNYYNETIPEEIFNNPDKLNEEVKAFAEKVDKNLYNVKPETQQTENSDKNQPVKKENEESIKEEPKQTEKIQESEEENKKEIKKSKTKKTKKKVKSSKNKNAKSK